ncbi:hypothetical protein GCM10007981_10700 [Thermocladium modestius]|uniref:Uncharacterized protein n=1 Tax=Thermocladium modestius TaxID=62609 RepID=A0A830GUF5_9CREN|nr:hypothetical protein [Thermocladium modestius]GGP20872.1 hypothetical protein GCM10007981_10700 [Thermocladium modestius]
MIERALLGVAYPLLVLAIAYLLFARLWRGTRGWVFVGVGYMLLALVIQIPIQEAPGAALVLTHGLIGAVAAEREWGPALAVYAGVVAGVAQEAAKFFAVKDREERAALWIGYGFAIIDIAVLIAEVAVALITSPNVSLQVVPMVGLILNPVVSAMFHPGTAMFLRLMQGRGGGAVGLLATTLAHAYIDSLAAYINYAAALAVIGGTGMYDLVGLLWSSSIAISAAFLFVGVRGVGGLPSPSRH